MANTRIPQGFDYAAPLECDVAIAGAELSGLIAGAVLANRGLRVVVIDEPPVVGGRGGALPHRGYWLDGGHRAGHDVTDLMFSWHHGLEAAREAGVHVHVRAVRSGLRIHLLPTPGSSEPGHLMDAIEWTPDGFAKRATDAFMCPPDAVPDFLAALQDLSNSTPQQAGEALEVPLGQWLRANVPNNAAHVAILNVVKSIFSDAPERASTGRLMKLMDLFTTSAAEDLQITGLADDPAVGGLQGLMEPFARGIEENGGQIILDHRPVAVEFDAERATGLVATSSSHLVLRVRARHTIIGYPVWNAVKLLPPERVEPELREMARKLEDFGTTGVGWVAGLRRMPRRLDTGEAETYPGWNRMLVGPERDFSGGFHFPSLGSGCAAPKGRHLLSCFILNWVTRDEQPHWPSLSHKLEHAKAYIRSLYRDFDDCIEWQSDRFINESPAVAAGWYWAPVARHGIRVPGCSDLYIASSTIEGDVGTVDGMAYAGLESARAILNQVS